jgi:hypothetical protein
MASDSDLLLVRILICTFLNGLVMSMITNLVLFRAVAAAGGSCGLAGYYLPRSIAAGDGEKSPARSQYNGPMEVAPWCFFLSTHQVISCVILSSFHLMALLENPSMPRVRRASHRPYAKCAIS